MVESSATGDKEVLYGKIAQKYVEGMNDMVDRAPGQLKCGIPQLSHGPFTKLSLCTKINQVTFPSPHTVFVKHFIYCIIISSFCYFIIPEGGRH